MDGSTPLLIACVTSASLEVLELLLNGLKDGEREEEQNITKEKRNVREYSGVEASIHDHRGNTPLSELLINYKVQHKSVGHHSQQVSGPTLDSNNDVEEAC